MLLSISMMLSLCSSSLSVSAVDTTSMVQTEGTGQVSTLFEDELNEKLADLSNDFGITSVEVNNNKAVVKYHATRDCTVLIGIYEDDGTKGTHMLSFEKGELKAVNGEQFDDPIKAIQKVEEIGAAYGIGRDMHVGDTIIGIKGRVGFEAAAPMLIIGAHRFLEKYTLSKWQQYWKDQVANWYGMFLHESQYLEPVMRDIEAMLTESQRNVNGTAILELRPLSFSTVGVESEDDLVKNKFGEYGETQKGWTADEAKGFIKVTSTALRAYYANHKDEKENI